MENNEKYMNKELNKEKLANLKNLLDFRLPSLASFTSLKDYGNKEFKSKEMY